LEPVENPEGGRGVRSCRSSGVAECGNALLMQRFVIERVLGQKKLAAQDVINVTPGLEDFKRIYSVAQRGQ
jgi:hypothetical protein